jgi:2-dehydropantoate 2-reductase
MLARGARAQYLEAHGLSIRGLQEFSVPVAVVTDPARLTGAATLVVATKTPGTAAALGNLAHARFGLVCSIQNGPLKNDILTQAFGSTTVIGALADTSGELQPGGEVLFTRNVNVYLGELCDGASERTERLARTIDTAGVRAAATPEYQTLEWSKFCAWAGLMSLSVTTRAATWKFLADPHAAQLLVRLVREMGVLARALGVRLSDQAVLPTASLCAGAEAEAAALVLRIGEEYHRKVPGHRMSALQDVDAGRALEVNETLGYACDKARAHALQLPLLEWFTALVRAIDGTRSGAVPRPLAPARTR